MPARTRRHGSSAVAAFLAFGLLILGLAVPSVASADTAPTPAGPANPPTVSADGLPTVQVNGVVWSMVTVGNTVYATGSFTQARPAGAAPGTSVTARQNLVAFNLQTGALTSFNHRLNGQGRHISVSPDQSRIYVSGDFTTVDGIARGHVAAFSTATGALITTFAPTSNNRIYAVTATNTTVYVGGSFTVAGGQTRTRLAAFNASNGALTAWAPSANHIVRGIVVAPNGRIAIGGQFSQVNGIPANALASVNNTNGQDAQSQPWGITNSGDNGGVWSLKSDGTNAYATTYCFTCGNIEGVVAFNPGTWAVTWMNDCHGDPYDTWANSTLVYNASHTHDCETSGGFPDPNPRQWKRAIVMTKAVTGILKPTTDVPRYGSWDPYPHPSVLNWWPTIPAGTFTGQDQGTWSVTGGGDYVVFGGEFTSVNGVAQQGLVRFATSNVAPDRRGPELTAGQMRPNASSITAGEVKVVWPQSWDMDNEDLTYRVYRGTATTPVYTVTAKSQWWNRTMMTWTDTGRPAGSTASYRVAVSDPFNNTITSSQSNTVTVPSTTSAYATSVLADSPSQYWRLGETTGTTAYDAVGTTNLAEGTGIARGAAGAVAGDAAITANGTTTGRAVTAVTVPSPTDAFTIEAWVRTTSTSGGVIAQYGEENPPVDVANTDKALFVDNAGRVHFGLSARGADRVTRYTTVRSTDPVNNGQWHHIVGTVGTGGTALYVDGAQVAGNAALTRANTRVGPGFWALGSGLLTGAPDAPTSPSLNGSIDEVALYPATLTSAQVAAHYSAATGAATNPSPTASFTATATAFDVAVDGSASTDTAPGTIASYSYNWGDSTAPTTGTSATANHTYAAAGTFTITLTVTDNQGATGTTTRNVTIVDPNANVAPTASFTATVTGDSVAVNGTSSDANAGQTHTYSYNWGDGTPVTTGSLTANHTYAAPGPYTITLTVTDNGTPPMSGTATRNITIAPPAAAEFARDVFDRTVPAGGWGTANVGGAWTASVGGTRLSVTAGAGLMTLAAAGNNAGAYLGGVAQTSSDITVGVTLNAAPSATGSDVYVSGRRINGVGEYRVRVRFMPDNTVRLVLSRVQTGVAEAFPGGEVVVPGLTYAPGTVLNVRVQTFGTPTTTVRARVWATGATEPTTWQLSRTDTTAALQANGAVGLAAYRPSANTTSTTFRFTAFSARPVA
jgi:PKD repeat protein